MLLQTKLLLAVTGAFVVAGAVVPLDENLSKSFFLQGTPTAPPAAVKTPVDLGTSPGFVAQVISWDKSPTATGYRIFLDGVIISLYRGDISKTAGVPETSTRVSITCGVKHRFNVQPFNNKGLAPLPVPLYVTPSCDHATS